MLQGCDYAFSSPSPKGLYDAGLRFAMRYVGPGTNDKLLHAAERDELWAAGLSVVLLAEGTANGALGGFNAGRAHAESALAGARALGAPDSLPIYFAVDFDVTTAQWATVAAYLDGAASVLGPSRVGVYGGIRAVQWAARDKVAAWFFQTYAWSSGQWYAGNHVEQYQNGVALAGGEIDRCRSKTDNFGQWEDDDMTATDDKVAAIWNFIENGERPVKPDTVTPPDYETMPNNWLGAQVAMAQQDAARAYAGVLELQKQLAALTNAIAGIQVGGAHTHSVTGETGPAVAAP